MLYEDKRENGLSCRSTAKSMKIADRKWIMLLRYGVKIKEKKWIKLLQWSKECEDSRKWIRLVRCCMKIKDQMD